MVSISAGTRADDYDPLNNINKLLANSQVVEKLVNCQCDLV